MLKVPNKKLLLKYIDRKNQLELERIEEEKKKNNQCGTYQIDQNDQWLVNPNP